MKVADGAKVFIKNNKLNKYLFILRDDKPDIIQPNTWGLLGGGIDDKESPLVALEREIREESNIIINRIRFLGEEKFTTNLGEKEYVITGNFFIAETNMEAEEFEIYEGQRAEYFTLDEILSTENVAPIIKKIIRKFKDKLSS